MIRVLGFLWIILLAQVANGFEYPLEFSQGDIQLQVDKMLPIKKETFLVVVTLDQATVILLENSDQIALEAKIFLTSVAGLNSQGAVTIKGKISYNSPEGAFYFHQAKVTNLDIQGVPPEFMPTLKDLAQQGLTQALAKHPIYILKEADIRQQLVKSSLKSVVIEDQKLKVILEI